MKDLRLYAQVVIKTTNVTLNRSKVRAARATRLFFFSRPIKLLICDAWLAFP